MFTNEEFMKGDFLLHYVGEMITADVAQKRENSYAKKRKGNYMYYFKHGSKNLWYANS